MVFVAYIMNLLFVLHIAPNCSIHDLSMALPEGVWPEMTNVTSEYVTVGSEIRLQCEDNLILSGNSKASCSSLGTWQVENVQCKYIEGAFNRYST